MPGKKAAEDMNGPASQKQSTNREQHSDSRSTVPDEAFGIPTGHGFHDSCRLGDVSRPHQVISCAAILWRGRPVYRLMQRLSDLNGNNAVAVAHTDMPGFEAWVHI